MLFDFRFGREKFLLQFAVKPHDFTDNADNDIDDPGDDVVIDEDFTGTQVTLSHDHAGNLINDGTFQYIYDALETRIEY